jgi:hypothetical protein
MDDPMKRRPKVDWTTTPEGMAAYKDARALAQLAANLDGFDRGLERNNVFKTFRVFFLPGYAYRRGFELHCEVVSCEDYAKIQPGHGPR